MNRFSSHLPVLMKIIDRRSIFYPLPEVLDESTMVWIFYKNNPFVWRKSRTHFVKEKAAQTQI